MTTRLKIGISPCPNDVYAFHGLLSGAVRVEGLDLAIELLDIEELNRALLAGELEAAKVSFAAVLPRASEFLVSPSGSALGFGVGPLLLAARGASASAPRPRVLLPGEHTTASLLYRLFHGDRGRIEQVLFSRIMPRLAAGEADLGVCIHEGRFTWREHGLELVEDLGARWEERTHAPLPLGGICARRALGEPLVLELASAIRASIGYARAHTGEALRSMGRHAQELDDDVLWKHVELYVNDWTLDLGETGRRALDVLADEARRAGILAPDAPALRVAGASARA